MIRIGLFSTSAEDSELSDLLTKNNYEIVPMHASVSLENIDVVLIDVNEESHISQVIEYLIQIKESTDNFTWVIADNYSTSEKHIYLQLGANGVITKSDQTKELPLVLNNFIRKVYPQMTDEQKRITDSLILNYNKQCLVVDNNIEIAFTGLEFRLLDILFKNVNTVVTYDYLFRHMWNSAKEQKIYQIATIVFNIRNKLPEDKRKVIQTVRSKGYMLKV